MTSFDIGLVSLAAMVVLVIGGLYVPIALMACSFVGVWAIKGSSLLASKMLGLAAYNTISSYYFGVVPLFVLMGFLVAESGIGRDAYDVANSAFRRLKGGLAVGTVGANAIFAAITGISIASAAIFTKIAVPEMVRHGYTSRFALGSWPAPRFWACSSRRRSCSFSMAYSPSNRSGICSLPASFPD
jgi:C4-dicarboxylate transporter DctM subunit